MYGLTVAQTSPPLQEPDTVCRVRSDIPLPTMHFQYSDQWGTVTKGYHSVEPKQCVSSHKEGIWGSFLMVTVLSDLSDNGRQGSKRAAKALED